MKILITGGRRYLLDIPADIRDEDLHFFKSKLEAFKPNTLIHGGAKGADFHYAAVTALGFPHIQLVQVNPNWDLYGKRAGLVRNLQMLNMLDPKEDLVIGFHGGNGTAHTLANARAMKIEIHYAPSTNWVQKVMF